MIIFPLTDRSRRPKNWRFREDVSRTRWRTVSGNLSDDFRRDLATVSGYRKCLLPLVTTEMILDLAKNTINLCLETVNPLMPKLLRSINVNHLKFFICIIIISITCATARQLPDAWRITYCICDANVHNFQIVYFPSSCHRD